ncbi:hypothetical protein PFISCL1PPCAC_25564, partial [Pristionchus fissidentatus]
SGNVVAGRVERASEIGMHNVVVSLSNNGLAADLFTDGVSVAGRDIRVSFPLIEEAGAPPHPASRVLRIS